MLYTDLFQNLDNSESVKGALFYIGDIIGNTNIILCYNFKTKKIYSSADEWLHLINIYYKTIPNHPYYTHLVNTYNHRMKVITTDYRYSKEEVISLITSFSRGTVHGYAGFFFIINHIIENKSIYNKYKIIVSENSSIGILQIIKYLKRKKVLTNNIIVLSTHIRYKFKSIKFIKNKWHIFPKNLDLNLIKQYLISDNILCPKNRICILKNSKSDNKTKSGIVNINVVHKFCFKNKLLLVEPTETDEITMINFLHSCSFLVVSWGSAFFKNYIYLSEKCAYIIVLVIGNDFINQYNQFKDNKNLITKFKKSKIIYYVTDTELSIDLSKYMKKFL